MFKKTFTFVFFLYFLILFLNKDYIYALSSKEKGFILDSFKKDQYELLFETNSDILDEQDRSILDVSRQIDIYSSIRNKVTLKKQDLEEKKETISWKIDSLEDAINSLDEDISYVTTNVNKINAQVIDVKNEIDINNKKIDILRKQIEENWVVLIDYLVYIYKKWNYISDEKSIDNIKTIILSWEDISWVIDDMHFKWIIEVAWKKLIDNHRSLVKELYLKKTENEKQEVNLKKLRKDLIIERKVLSDKKDFKNRLLSISKWKEALYEKYISDKTSLEKKLTIKELQEKIKLKNLKDSLFEKYDCDFIDLWDTEISLEWVSQRCIDLNKMIYSESLISSDPDKQDLNIFSWPVDAIYGLSSYYRDKEYADTFWSEHDAIDIITPQWTDVKAAKDWYVIFIQAPLDESYSYVAIKHSDWFVTVYWHLNEVLVNEYDFVKKWEVFAKSGWEFWTNWAWIMTTWPHLHFEVFRDKEYEDPLRYLDTSYLLFANLPEKYHYKFFQDFKDRKWYEYKNRSSNSKVFSLDWDTEAERQKSLLDKYAVWEFKNWNMWVEESLDWNIDPTFVMCIWLAETWLWRNMKTKYNIWNVWNTDSGWTMTFNNARSWVYMIVSTLNNKILWWYEKIEELSRYWNKTWAIYASSPDNWHNNIIKCMSSIKWIYISDDYRFRLVGG